MAQRAVKKYKECLSGSPATLTLIAINILVFIGLKLIPGLADDVLLNPQTSLMEKPWTLITVFFSHEVHIHLLVNMVLLLFFGAALEDIAGASSVTLIYLLAGSAGSLTFRPFVHIIGGTGPVVGASAAVFGVVAAFAAISPNARILRSTAKAYATVLFVVNAILLIINPQMSVGAPAHAAGIVVGLIYGLFRKRNSLKD